ncbi:molybdate ABC transporter substrate-binding protein [Novosphingobium sp. 1949]|uniref:Molybdate ABC transporter substrate-binding protein n=1 Tax=Novosphingobium organovorum TaxID=2930092 RepID=A0ABT0BA64_9SPHN|nr:molybdate ABC transporter substrate-binding protein [Novosphingobium organovorum]MCJ2181975.1 molybdate ABC transporter substrate-binding protein [Novosphingobium organovorum]
MNRFGRWLAAFTLTLGLVANAGIAHAAGPLVLAAASLRESMTAAADAWAAKGHEHPVVSFAASSALARQIEADAPADIFVSADEEWMNYLQQRKLIKPATRKSFLANDIVLIAPANSPVKLAIRKGFPLARTLGDGRLAMGDPNAVPAGRYGKQALENLGVWDSVAAKVAAAQNVRVALAFVDRGETPLGIVYATDAKQDKGVRVVSVFPRSSHTPVTYPIALVAKSTNRDAEAFRKFLISKDGKAIFARYGFGAL